MLSVPEFFATPVKSKKKEKDFLIIYLSDDQIKTSKRYTNGSIKHETNTDIIDNGTQQKKSKTSHVHKQEPTTISMNIKEEPNVVFSNEISSTDNMATVAPMMVQPKKEKPTAK